VSSFADEVAALRGTKSATLKDLLTHPAFSRLLAAMTVSSLGDWVGFVAVASLVANLVNGPAKGFAVGGVMAARMLPALLFGPIAGVLVDRFDRKKIMITADISRGLMYGSMAFVHSLPLIFLLSFAIECFSLLWSPARDASLPNLVPRRQLANANSIGLVSTYGTLPLGGAIFAILVVISGWMGLEQKQTLALLLDAGTFAFSAFMVSRIPIRMSGNRSMGRFDLSRVWRDIQDGVRFLREDSMSSAMTGGIVIAFAAVGAVLAIGPIFVGVTIKGGDAGWGVLVVAFGIGMAIGMVGQNQAVKFVEREVIFVLSLVAASGALFLFASMPNLSFATGVAVWLGLFCGLAWVSGYTLLQENVEDEYRGRTFASLTVLSRLGLFLSLTIFPALSSIYDQAVHKLLGNDPQPPFGALHGFHVGHHDFDLSGTRLALWTAGFLALAAGLNTRRLLRRYRISRPQPLALVPKLKRPPATGLFIAFEGVEGAGKGTQLVMAEEYLRSAGHSVLVTREPGGTELGEKVRQVLLDPKTGKVDARSEALLFAAARAQSVSTVIRPALADGKVVICDRYIDSSLAYQGWARGLGEQDVLTLNVWATQGLFPDLVILLHLEPERGLLRSTEAPDRMELEGQDFHAKVADAYLKIAEEHPERFVVVDADKEPSEVFEDVKAALDRVVRDREDHAGATPAPDPTPSTGVPSD
jgi:dTMP kinase